jgi:hypothetical protein
MINREVKVVNFSSPDIVASRSFQKEKASLFDGFEAGFFIERTDKGIILEIETSNKLSENSQRIPLTKNALKELAVMFQAASEEDYPQENMGLDIPKKSV